VTGSKGEPLAGVPMDSGGAEPPVLPLRRRRLWPWVLSVVVLLPVLVVGGVVGLVWHLCGQPGPLAESKAVVVPRGASDQIAGALVRAGVVADGRVFLVASWVSGKDGPLRAGEYAFPAHANVWEVLHVLRTARPVQHRMTIPEGLTARQAQALLGRTETLAGEMPALEEAAWLPETYGFERGTLRTTVMDRAKAAMTKALADAWAGREQGLPLANAREALILASIVERETGKPEERPRVAAVFLNRLRQGMRLQSDPTVVYAASDGLGVLDRPISRADLDKDSPFNTYKMRGLPPTPIAAPGMASIQAVLHPAKSDDLYFVADGTGGHVFARTLEEHNRNVAKWRAQQSVPPAALPGTQPVAPSAPPAR